MASAYHLGSVGMEDSTWIEFFILLTLLFCKYVSEAWVEFSNKRKSSLSFKSLSSVLFEEETGLTTNIYVESHSSKSLHLKWLNFQTPEFVYSV